MINYDEKYKDYPSRIEGILLEGFGAMGDTPTISDGSITGGKVIGEEDGDIIINGELRVDTADDLPAYDSIEGYILRNCIALVVHTGDIWAQDSAGEWYNQTNPVSETPAATSAASTLNLSPTSLEKSVIKSENTADTLSKSENIDIFDDQPTDIEDFSEPTEEMPDPTVETAENDDYSEPARSDADDIDI